MRPLISVITVCYNSALTIRETIDSVVNQSFNDYEYVIIDGGSSDGTVDIIKEYGRSINYFISEKDAGIYDAMNKAVDVAKGAYIYFIGSDDTFANSDVLEKVSSYLKSPSIIYYGDVLFTTQNRIYDGEFNKLKMATRNISHQSIFYPISVFLNKRYDTKYKIFADYALNISLFNSKNYSFKYIPLLICNFNDQGASGAKTKDQVFEREFISLIKAHFPFYITWYRYLRTMLSKLVKNE